MGRLLVRRLVGAPTASFYADTLSAGEVATWPDGSGNGRYLTQASSEARPTRVTDSRDGKAGVRFAAGLTLSAAVGAFDFLHQQDCTVLIAWRQRELRAAATYPLLATSAGSASKGFRLVADDAAGQRCALRTYVSNGATDIIAKNTTFDGYPALLWTVSVVSHSPTRVTMGADGVEAKDDVVAVTLPTGASGQPLTIGGEDIEIAGIEIYSPALSDEARDAAVSRLAARFDIPQITFMAKSAGSVINPPGATRYYAFPSLIMTPGGVLLASWRESADHSVANDSQTWLCRSTDGGVSWGTTYEMLPGQLLDLAELQLTALANGDILAAYCNEHSPPNLLRTSRSADDGLTWSEPVTVTSSFTGWAACSAPVVEKAGKLYWPIYGKDTEDTYTSIRVLVSSDNGATWPNEYTVATGADAGFDLQEPNIVELPDGDLLIVIRSGNGSGARETVSTDAGETWSELATGPRSGASPRLFRFADGEVVCISRNQATATTTMFRRLGAGSWTGAWAGGWSGEPMDYAQGLDALGATCVHGAIAEPSPGIAAIIYSEDSNLTVQSDVRFRRWPEWQIRALNDTGFMTP